MFTINMDFGSYTVVTSTHKLSVIYIELIKKNSGVYTTI